MDNLLIAALIALFVSIPFLLGYKSAWATSGRRGVSALVSFFFFAGIVGLGLWGLGSVIGKRRTVAPATTAATPNPISRSS